MRRSLRNRWILAAAALLVSFVVGFAADLVHTDDGCQVEIHCLACQRTLASVSVAAIVTHWCPHVALLGPVATPRQTPTHAAATPVAGSRAPPLA